MASVGQARKLADVDWKRRRHQALRSGFTNREWERAADQASAERREEAGNRRYTPPRLRQR